MPQYIVGLLCYLLPDTMDFLKVCRLQIFMIIVNILLTQTTFVTPDWCHNIFDNFCHMQLGSGKSRGTLSYVWNVYRTINVWL